MNLRIETLAKVALADLVFDGITVIVGDDNTGKSVVKDYAMPSETFNLFAKVHHWR